MTFRTLLHILSFFIILYLVITKYDASDVKDHYSKISVDDKSFLIANTGNNRILLVNNKKSDYFGSGDIQFSIPQDIAVYQTDVYIADTGNNRILVTDRRGNLKREWGGFGWCYKECGSNNFGDSSCADGKFNNPRGLSILNGEVYVTDKCNHRIQVFDLNGNFKRKWGSFGSSNGEFNTPIGITTYENEIYVTDAYNYRVQVFDPDGTFKRKWGSYGIKYGEFNSPVRIACYENNVFVSERNNHRIQIFDTKGNFMRSFGTLGSGSTCLNEPYGLTVYQDKVYIADRSNHRIQVFNIYGSFVNTWGNRGICQNDRLRKYFKKVIPFFCNELNYYGPMGVTIISGDGSL